jgi:hypothetical protein
LYKTRFADPSSESDRILVGDDDDDDDLSMDEVDDLENAIAR